MATQESDPAHYRAHRQQDLHAYQERSRRSIYPNHWPIDLTLRKFIRRYDVVDKLENGTRLEEDGLLSVAGRIESIRNYGKKLFFFHIWQDEPALRVQVLANKMFYGVSEDSDDPTCNFFGDLSVLRRGDVVGVRGWPARSKKGELSINPDKVVLLAPCWHMLPLREEIGELTGVKSLVDPETRFRQRYLDLRVHLKSREIFRRRSLLMQELRQFLEELDFMEVETPELTLIPGGASAKPFITYHHELDVDMYLRIAPELYLKQLVVGGFDRVYEIGKNFRNEGIDLTHNPEFTACELYWAYASYHELMTMTEGLLSRIVSRVGQSEDLKVGVSVGAGAGGADEKKEIDFTPPYRRISMIDELERKLEVKFPVDLGGEECRVLLEELMVKVKADCGEPRTNARLLDKLVGAVIEPDCWQPTFITDHPRIMSPLAKPREDNPQLTERFELFVAGREICNAYTELNDPELQLARFREQAKAKELGDVEACGEVDVDYVRALEYGLPPCAGWGLGIDRLLMLLTDSANIREVILFPTMKKQI